MSDNHCRIKPEIATRWADALVSGEFAQGHRRLKTASGDYCCLGVLCELYRRETGNGEWKLWRGDEDVDDGPLFHQTPDTPSGYGAEDYPTSDVYDWAGLDEDFACELASANDAGASFTKIAEKIRQNAKKGDLGA